MSTEKFTHVPGRAMLAALGAGRDDMTLAIFDLDNTLLGGDSDNLWGQFVCERGLVDADDFAARNEQFFEDYKAGDLDIDAYLRFALSSIAGHSAATLRAWHDEFMSSKIEPIMLPKAQSLLDSHRRQGHTLLIITATNSFITRPIAERLGVTELIAAEAEIKDGLYTGAPTGVPSYQHGKVSRLETWCAQTGAHLTDAYFYSDSHNDLPLLEVVDNPIAVDPDDILLDAARSRGWPVMSLR